MIEIVRFDHISMGVAEIDPQIELLESLFGFRYTGRFEEEGLVGANLDVPGTSGVAWELLAPNGPDSHLHRFLQGPSGPGIHHVALRVPAIQAAASALRAHGIEPWGMRERDSAAEETWDRPRVPQEPGGIAYIHPRQGGNGLLFQLYEGDPWHTPSLFEDDGEHSLGIKAVNHLAHAHPDRDALASWYMRVFGMQLAYRSPAEDDSSTNAFATEVLDTPTRQLRFEIIAPATPNSFIQHFLDRRGPSVHHVTFEVADWDHAVAACTHHGVGIFGERSGETDGVPWREAFIHPRDTGGMLAQFFWQAAPGVWI